jgi:hypothetical protein
VKDFIGGEPSVSFAVRDFSWRSLRNSFHWLKRRINPHRSNCSRATNNLVHKSVQSFSMPQPSTAEQTCHSNPTDRQTRQIWRSLPPTIYHFDSSSSLLGLRISVFVSELRHWNSKTPTSEIGSDTTKTRTHHPARKEAQERLLTMNRHQPITTTMVATWERQGLDPPDQLISVLGGEQPDSRA